jgi:hypothetical protein
MAAPNSPTSNPASLNAGSVSAPTASSFHAEAPADRHTEQLNRQQSIYFRLKATNPSGTYKFANSHSLCVALLPQLGILPSLSSTGLFAAGKICLTIAKLARSSARCFLYTASFLLNSPEGTQMGSPTDIVQLLLRAQAIEDAKDKNNGVLRGFLFDIPIITPTGRKESASRVTFSYDIEPLLGYTTIDFQVKVPPSISIGPAEDFALLISQLITPRTASNEADYLKVTLQDRLRFANFCKPQRVFSTIHGDHMDELMNGTFLLNLDEPDARDVFILQHLVFGAFFGIDPRFGAHQQFQLYIPVLHDHKQLAKRPAALREAIDNIKCNSAIIRLLPAKPLRNRSKLTDASTSETEAESAFLENISRRSEALDLLSAVPSEHSLGTLCFPSLRDPSFTHVLCIPQAEIVTDPLDIATVTAAVLQTGLPTAHWTDPPADLDIISLPTNLHLPCIALPITEIKPLSLPIAAHDDVRTHCMRFQEGNCNRGVHCPYGRHEILREISSAAPVRYNEMPKRLQKLPIALVASPVARRRSQMASENAGNAQIDALFKLSKSKSKSMNAEPIIASDGLAKNNLNFGNKMRIVCQNSFSALNHSQLLSEIIPPATPAVLDDAIGAPTAANTPAPKDDVRCIPDLAPKSDHCYTPITPGVSSAIKLPSRATLPAASIAPAIILGSIMSSAAPQNSPDARNAPPANDTVAAKPYAALVALETVVAATLTALVAPANTVSPSVEGPFEGVHCNEDRATLNALAVRLAASPRSPNFSLLLEFLYKPTETPITIHSHESWPPFVHTLQFRQLDYGTSFNRFWCDELSLTCDMITSKEASEDNRCLLLHLGIAMNIHPFGLQLAFRARALNLLRSIPYENDRSELQAIHLDSLFDMIRNVSSSSSNSFLDSSILLSCWPLELENYCVIIWNERAALWQIFNPAPCVANVQPYLHRSRPLKEIVLHLSSVHYTLLRYDQGSLFEKLTKHMWACEKNCCTPCPPYRVAVTEPMSFLCVNRGFHESPVAHTSSWVEAAEPFSIRQYTIPFFCDFPLSVLSPVLIQHSALPHQVIHTPPLNSVERRFYFLFPQPCKRSGYFHDCCGSNGNCHCGSASNELTLCACSYCDWRWDEDSLSHCTPLTICAYESVLNRLPCLMETWLSNSDTSTEAHPIWHLILERLTTMIRTLQRHHYKNLSPNRRNNLTTILHSVTVIIIRTRTFFSNSLAADANKMYIRHCNQLLSFCEISIERFLLPQSQNVDSSNSSSPSRIDSADSSTHSSPPDVILNSNEIRDSIQSLCSDDIPMVYGHQQTIDEAFSAAMEHAKGFFFMATERLHTITLQNKPIALLQLATLKTCLTTTADNVRDCCTGISTTPLKYRLSLDQAMRHANGIGFLNSELDDLIALVVISPFSPAPAISKNGKVSARVNGQFCASRTSTLFPEKICERVFAALQNLSQALSQRHDDETFIDLDVRSTSATPHDAFEDTTSGEDYGASQLADDEQETLRLRKSATSSASVFNAEAFNADGSQHSDSALSKNDPSQNDSDRQFVHDSLESRTDNPRALLFRQELCKDRAPSAAPGVRSFTKSESITSLGGHCSKGHVINRRAVMKIGKTQDCSFCMKSCPNDIFSCCCYLEYACLQCLTDVLTHPAPPRCTLPRCLGACLLRVIGCSRVCHIGQHTIPGSTPSWQCCSYACKYAVCVQCNASSVRNQAQHNHNDPEQERSQSVPRLCNRNSSSSTVALVDDTVIVSTRPPRSSSLSSAHSSSRANAKILRGTPAPMPANRL